MCRSGGEAVTERVKEQRTLSVTSLRTGDSSPKGGAKAGTFDGGAAAQPSLHKGASGRLDGEEVS